MRRAFANGGAGGGGDDRSSRLCHSADENSMHPEVFKLHKNMEKTSSAHQRHHHPPSASSSSSSPSSAARSVALSTSDSFTFGPEGGDDGASSFSSSSSSSSSPSLPSSPSQTKRREDESPCFSFSSAPSLDDVHMVVGGALGYAIVYRSILGNRIRPASLPRPTCSLLLHNGGRAGGMNGMKRVVWGGGCRAR